MTADNNAMHAEPPTARFQVEDQPRRPGDRRRYHSQTTGQISRVQSVGFRFEPPSRRGCPLTRVQRLSTRPIRSGVPPKSLAHASPTAGILAVTEVDEVRAGRCSIPTYPEWRDNHAMHRSGIGRRIRLLKRSPRRPVIAHRYPTRKHRRPK